MQTLGITVTDAGVAAAAALGFREATLDHGLGGFEELSEELLPTHLKILRYNRSVSQSREKTTLHIKNVSANLVAYALAESCESGSRQQRT